MRISVIYFNVIVFEKLLHFFTKKSWFFITPNIFGFVFHKNFFKTRFNVSYFLDFNGKAYAYLLKTSILVKIYL